MRLATPCFVNKAQPLPRAAVGTAPAALQTALLQPVSMALLVGFCPFACVGCKINLLRFSYVMSRGTAKPKRNGVKGSPKPGKTLSFHSQVFVAALNLSSWLLESFSWVGIGTSHIQAQVLVCPGVVGLQQEELRLRPSLQPAPSLVSSHISGITPSQHLGEHRLGPQSHPCNHTVGNPLRLFQKV